MSSQTGRLALQDVIEQGWKQLQGGFLEQLKKTIEGLLAAERDRRVAERRERGEKIYRWGYTVRKCWQTAWGALEQVRVPRLRGREEIGLLEKYQRHAMQEAAGLRGHDAREEGRKCQHGAGRVRVRAVEAHDVLRTALEEGFQIRRGVA